MAYLFHPVAVAGQQMADPFATPTTTGAAQGQLQVSPATEVSMFVESRAVVEITP